MLQKLSIVLILNGNVSFITTFPLRFATYMSPEFITTLKFLEDFMSGGSFTVTSTNNLGI